MRLTTLALGLLLAACATTASAAPTYTYVGSWFVDQGPDWSQTDANGNYTTPVLSGLEAAAFIFGGNASDYAISTIDEQAANINFKAWMDGWSDDDTYGMSGNAAAQDLHIDINNDGLYAIPFNGRAAYSAYVMDHGLHLQNFAFKIADNGQVPEPASVALIGLGLAGLAMVRRRTNTKT